MSLNVHEYFPASNTPEGFFSYYDYILNPYEANRIIILKGGPGTGKSTLMRSIASHLISLGYETELLHCSSDPDSLDGVRSFECGFLIVDGTKPHVVEPKVPGAVEEIVNLGSFWDAEKIRQNKNDIIDVNAKISKCFEIAYNYLASAKNLYNCIYVDVKTTEDKEKTNQICENIKKEFSLSSDFKKTPAERKAFLSAFTPVGEKEYINTFSKNSTKVYKLKSSFVYPSSDLLNSIKELFKNSGYDTLSFYSPMFPTFMEHLYIPCFNVFFTTEKYVGYDKQADVSDEVILQFKTPSLYSPGYEYEIYSLLINKATQSLAQAKKLHDELEMFYKPYMDFGKIEALGKNIINSLK